MEESRALLRGAEMALRAHLEKGELSYCDPLTEELNPDCLVAALELPRAAAVEECVWLVRSSIGCLGSRCTVMGGFHHSKVSGFRS